jgi:hypothetical protein
MSDIIHVIRLIKQSSNGYVQLCQLKQKYREKYGRDLCQRPLKKWLDKIPDVYIDHHPVNDSIHVHETHEAHEGNDEQIPKNQNNNNINNKKRQKKKKKKKTANASARSRLQENTQTCISPLLLPSCCSPQRQKTTLTCLGTTRGAAIAASAATKTTEQEKEKEQEGFESNEPPASLHLSQAREVNGKKAPESKKKKAKKTKNLAMIMEEQKLQKKKIGEKKATKKKNKGGDGVNDLCFAFARTKAKAKMKKAVVPIRNDCYYGMANHTANSKEGDSKGRRCIMHFGFTSSGKTCWSKNTFKTKEQVLYKSKTPFSSAIVSGYMANKIKNSCGQKAARKARNLARLRKKYNPRPAAPTAHALQRYKERGKYSSPVYKPTGANQNNVVVMTYMPIQREIYADSKSSTLTIRREVKRMSRLSKQTDLPKSKLSSRDAYLFKLSSQALKKEECRRRLEKRERAYAKRSPTTSLAASQQIDKIFPKKKWKKKKTAKSNKGRTKACSQEHKQITGGLQ